MHRRTFVTGGVCAFAALGSIRTSVGQSATGTRRSVRGMTANDPNLAAYRQAVAAMKALPPSDPRNWNRFADLHRNFCPHSNWYFLPWHRAYLVALERICRDLTGRADFALPYWDWTAQRQLPLAFVEGTPRSNPLNHARPGFPGNASLPDDMVGTQVMARILASPDFEAFGSARPRGQNNIGVRWQRRMGAAAEFEFNPHNGVHGILGGDMAQVATASRDPIFYLHHANVDRIWTAWNARGNANSSVQLWRNFVFNRNFVNPNGSPWSVAVNDLQSPAALGYRYDSEDGPFAADIDVAGTAAAVENPFGTALQTYRRLGEDGVPYTPGQLHRVGLPAGGSIYVAVADNDRSAAHERAISIPVPLGRPLADIIKPSAIADPSERRERHAVWAMLRDIEAPADPSTRVHVFVNGEGARPGMHASDPHYVTSLSFFGANHGDHRAQAHGHHSHHGDHAQHQTSGASACVDLTPALSRIRATRQFRTDKIAVQLMPVCRYGNTVTSQMRPRRVEIAII